MRRKLTIGLTLPLTGRYAEFGRQAAAALNLFAVDQNAAGGIVVGGDRREVAIECLDDRSSPKLCAEHYRSLCYENRADLIFGPYSSELTRVAAPIAEQAGMVLINHGGADDGLYRQKYRLVVGVLSPASDYLTAMAELISRFKFWRKRVATVNSATPFARSVIAGFEQACEQRAIYRRGVRLKVRESVAAQAAEVPIDLLIHLARARINVLVSAGSFANDIALIRAVIRANLNIPVIACVAAGVQGFAAELGEQAEGIVGPSQWEETVAMVPELGPRPDEFARRVRAVCAIRRCDYPAAQIYAAGLLTAQALRACPTLEQDHLRDALADLRTSTLFGDFAIDRVTGCQIAHKVLLVQWHAGEKVVIHPDAHAEAGVLEFPPAWRWALSSLHLWLHRKDEDGEDPAGD